MERVWRDLHDDLAWQQFPDLPAQQEDVGDLIRAYAAATLQSLTSYSSFVNAVNALFSELILDQLHYTLLTRVPDVGSRSHTGGA